MSDEREEYDVQYEIPVNYKGGIYISDFQVKVRNLIEAGVLTLILFRILRGTVMPLFFEDVSAITGSSIAFLLPISLLAIIGIDGDSLLQFLFNVLKYFSKRRTAFYNKRIKKEAKSIVTKSTENRNIVSREAVLGIINEYRGKLEKRALERAQQLQYGTTNVEEVIVFKDDKVKEEQPERQQSVASKLIEKFKKRGDVNEEKEGKAKAHKKETRSRRSSNKRGRKPKAKNKVR